MLWHSFVIMAVLQQKQMIIIDFVIEFMSRGMKTIRVPFQIYLKCLRDFNFSVNGKTIAWCHEKQKKNTTNITTSLTAKTIIIDTITLFLICILVKVKRAIFTIYDATGLRLNKEKCIFVLLHNKSSLSISLFFSFTEDSINYNSLYFIFLFLFHII